MHLRSKRTDWTFPGIELFVIFKKCKIAAARIQALIRTRFSVLHFKMWIVSICFTLLIWRTNTKPFPTTLFNITVSRLYLGSSYTWSVFHINPTPEQSKPINPYENHSEPPLKKKKKGLESYHFNYDFVLVCFHQYRPAAAVTPEALLQACSWMLRLTSITKCCLLPLSALLHRLISFSGLVAKNCVSAGCFQCKQS